MRKILLLVVFFASSLNVLAQVGINTQTPQGALDVVSPNSGLVVPRVANTAAVIAPVDGMIIYDLSQNCFKGYQSGFWSECGFVASAAQVAATSSGGTALVSNYSCSTASGGTMTEGVAASGVTQTVTATVTEIGTYSVSATANGITFTGSGTFAGVGDQDIVLTASGTPAAAGANDFTLNTTPNCNFSRTTLAPITPPEPLPANIQLGLVNPHLIISVFDQDYAPYTTIQATSAVLPNGSSNEIADGVNESTTLNVQGIINTTGITISIPYKVFNSAVSLPAYSQTINIPSLYTEDGISRDIVFSYPATQLSIGSGKISATIKSIDGTLNIKKLDIQTGIGNDFLGVLLGQFTYAFDEYGSTGNVDVRVISGIPDRNIADANHVMLYLPVKVADGTIWLNNNLGADYSNANRASFNPSQQAIAFNDWKAYGSLYQWGRFSDGHESINWISGTAGTAVNGTTTNLSASDNPDNALFIINGTLTNDWRSTANNNLWQGGSTAQIIINNPCPLGFRVPLTQHWDSFVNSSYISNLNDAANSALKITSAGYRARTDGNLYAVGLTSAIYWSCETNYNSQSNYRGFEQSATYKSNAARSFALPIRCVRGF